MKLLIKLVSEILYLSEKSQGKFREFKNLWLWQLCTMQCKCGVKVVRKRGIVKPKATAFTCYMCSSLHNRHLNSLTLSTPATEART